MSYLDALKQATNKTATTENGAVTNNSTLNPVLDFFSMAGAMRGNVPDANKLFRRAYAEDNLATVRTLFYLRDIRGGQGERDLFRALLTTLREIDPKSWGSALKYIPEYGRWDDLLQYGTAPEALEIVKAQIAEDIANMKAGKSVSLMAKWLPSENTSSHKTVTAARALAKALDVKPSQYRKAVVALRKHIKLLEHTMSANQWAELDYSKLPSQAQRKHAKAFKRHDEDRYTSYLEAATKGEAKMNTSTLYTYEVLDAIRSGNSQAADAMWANLPDYTDGTNALVVADVSGSMTGRPMDVSVSLALYFAEHNTGIFKDHFITFSNDPKILKVVGKSLTHRLRNIENAEWGMSTNLEAVFTVLLNAAVKSGRQEDMPKVIYVISDMEFNQAVANPNATVFENAQAAYEANNVPMPHVVFWNVDARQVQAPATKFDNHVTLISGLSQSTFQYAVAGKTPEELMNSVINSERYAKIVL